MTDLALVVEVSPDRAHAVVETRGQRRRLSLAVLTLEGREVRPGDWVLAGAGLAVETIAEAEALALRDFLDGEDR